MSPNAYVCVPVTFFHSKWITKVRSLLLRASTQIESLWRKTRIWNSLALFRFVSLHTTSHNATCKNCGRSDNVNCPHGSNHKKRSDHENLYSCNFSQFHENFEPRKFGAIQYAYYYVYMLGICLYCTWCMHGNTCTMHGKHKPVPCMEYVCTTHGIHQYNA